MRLLAEYRDDLPGLMVYLVTLREEATAELAELHPAAAPADLHRRFTDWVPVESRQSLPLAASRVDTSRPG